MTLKTRMMILSVLAVLFLIIAPYLVLYSFGYRINLEKRVFTATGGIYVRIQPSGAIVTVDGKISDATGVFSNSVFLQNLLPKEHDISIKKDGYYDYQKNLLVKEKEVTKLENVILFNKNIPFELLDDTAQFSTLRQILKEKFAIKNNNLYYSNIQENSQLTPAQKSLPVLKSILSFKISGNRIIWFGLDGFLKSSDLNGQNTENISKIALKINPKKVYALETFPEKVFLKEGSNLLMLNQQTKTFQDFYSSVNSLKISPDGKKIIYFNDNEIFIYYPNNNLPADIKNKALLQKTLEKIKGIYWLNNDYIIFNSPSKIFISEIDTRGNVNLVSLPETLFLADGKSINIVKPDIFFDQSAKKLYILTQNQLLFSDKIIP